MSPATTRISLIALAAVATLVLSLALAGVAAAAPVAKDGMIHACYRVKGKPKGAMRVVKSGQARCQRGERRLAWVATGALGAAGGNSILSTSELEETIDLLTARVVALEGILQGVSNGQLLAAINSVPLVETICGRVVGLIGQTNLLRGSVNTLVSTLTGSLLGAIFGGVTVPPLLPETLACPEP